MLLKPCFSFLLLLACSTLAAQDSWTGSWQYRNNSNQHTIQIDLSIGLPEKNLLYPAELCIMADSFYASYHLLFAKKNAREFAISRNKFNIPPSSFGNKLNVFYFNGILDKSRNLKGNATLTLNRLLSKSVNTLLPIPVDDTEAASAWMINTLLSTGDITFTRINNQYLNEETGNSILSTPESLLYFSVRDSTQVSEKAGTFSIYGYKKAGMDIASLGINGKIIAQQITVGKKSFTDEVVLDTGMNTIIFFADNYEKQTPSQAQLQLKFGDNTISLNMNDKRDSGASFIAARLYYADKNAVLPFKNIYNLNQEYPLQPDEKLITAFETKSKTVKFAIWDDAVEDGDSISISVNNEWLVQGLPVKKNPQFIEVPLTGGMNIITFIGDNLGAIPPNTSVLEIIDGKKRKSFMIETKIGQKNLMKIVYDNSR